MEVTVNSLKKMKIKIELELKKDEFKKNKEKSTFETAMYDHKSGLYSIIQKVNIIGNGFGGMVSYSYYIVIDNEEGYIGESESELGFQLGSKSNIDAIIVTHKSTLDMQDVINLHKLNKQTK